MMVVSRTERMPKTPPTSAEEVIRGASPRPKRWRRRVVRALVFTPLALLLIVLVLGQTPVVNWVVKPIVSEQTGLDMRAGSIKLMPNGRVVIRQAEFFVPGVDGQASRVIEVDRAVVMMDWWSTLRGSAALSSVHLDGPEIRLSQSSETGKLNLSEIVLGSGGGGDSTLPAIQIVGGIVEIGEHDSQDYRVLKRLRVSGQSFAPDAQGISSFEFVALPVEPSLSEPNAQVRGTLALSGTVSDAGVQGTLDGFRLEDWPASIVPSSSRPIYERLGLAGELATTRFSLASDGELTIELTLDGVGLNLPFDDEYSMVGDGELLRMRDTRGTIRFGTEGVNAELSGMVDELGYRVDIDYGGLSTDSPFACSIRTDFTISDEFRPRKFLPESVIAKLDRFTDLKLDVDATLNITRGSPADGGEIDISGNAKISNGTARYKKFPYPFSQLSGVIRFDSDQLVVERIEGLGPTGAELVSTGLFAPLGEHSVVKLNLDIKGLAIDDSLRAAMSNSQRKLVDSLFSESKYSAIIEDGLLLTAEDRRSLEESRRLIARELRAADEIRRPVLAQELASIEAMLEVPGFDFGGNADISVVLRRHPERASDNRWTTETDVLLDHAGLVPKHFPLPIVANEVRIFIDDDHVELTGGQYTGLSGGWATVDVFLDLTEQESGIKPLPVIGVKVRDIPIDQRLIAAIPGYRDDQGDDPDAVTLRRILDRLRLDGMVECDAVLGARANNKLGYDVEALITEGTARPMPMPELYPDGSSLTIDPIAMDKVIGTIYLTEEMIVVDLDGHLYSPDQPLAPTEMHVLTQLTLPSKAAGFDGVRRDGGLLPLDFGPPAPGPQMYVRARADGLDLAMPLEHAVAVVSPTIARQMSSWRERTNPDALLAVQSTIEGYVGGYASTTLVLDRIEHFAIDLGDQRYRTGASWGRATLDLGVLPRIGFDGFRVPLKVDGLDAGIATLHGDLSLARGRRYYEPSSDDTLDVHYADGRLGSGLVRAIIAQGGDDGIDVMSDYDIDGKFDLAVLLTPRDVGLIDRGVDGAIVMPPLAIDGRFDPSSLSFNMNERQIEFPQVSGSVQFEGTKGTVEELKGTGDGYAMGIDGDWAFGDGGLGVDLRIDASGGVLDSPLRGVVPRVLDRVITNLELGSTGAIDISGLRLVADGVGTGEMDFNVSGGAEIVGGHALIGAPITELDGSVDFVAASVDGRVGYEIGLNADQFRAGALRLSEGSVQIIGDAARPGVVLIPEIDASMHGGRVAGSAQIRPSEDGQARYWAELHGSGVRAAPMFNDLLLPPGGLEGPPVFGEDRVRSAWDVDDDYSRGVMLADLSMSGILGEPGTRVGRGYAQVSGGSVVALPGILNVLEASNLRLPVGSKLQNAEGEFYIDGDTLAFERISATSKTIEILGYGTMQWIDRALDLRFRSRSIARIPVLSSMFEGLRDELITTKVTGTLSKPTYSVDQFGSTKRVLSALLGRSETDQQRRLREVEQSVDASRSKTKNPTAAAVHDSMPIGEQWGQWVDDESPEH